MVPRTSRAQPKSCSGSRDPSGVQPPVWRHETQPIPWPGGMTGGHTRGCTRLGAGVPAGCDGTGRPFGCRLRLSAWCNSLASCDRMFESPRQPKIRQYTPTTRPSSSRSRRRILHRGMELPRSHSVACQPSAWSPHRPRLRLCPPPAGRAQLDQHFDRGQGLDAASQRAARC